MRLTRPLRSGADAVHQATHAAPGRHETSSLASGTPNPLANSANAPSPDRRRWNRSNGCGGILTEPLHLFGLTRARFACRLGRLSIKPPLAGALSTHTTRKKTNARLCPRNPRVLGSSALPIPPCYPHVLGL